MKTWSWGEGAPAPHPKADPPPQGLMLLLAAPEHRGCSPVGSVLGKMKGPSLHQAMGTSTRCPGQPCQHRVQSRRTTWCQPSTNTRGFGPRSPTLSPQCSLTSLFPGKPFEIISSPSTCTRLAQGLAPLSSGYPAPTSAGGHGGWKRWDPQHWARTERGQPASSTVPTGSTRVTKEPLPGVWRRAGAQGPPSRQGALPSARRATRLSPPQAEQTGRR